jgi:hypothetical protein
MIFDKENSFCFNTTLVAAAGAAVVLGDVMDLWSGNASLPNPVPPTGGPLGNLHDIFAGNQAEFFGQVTTAVAQAANTVTFALTIADAAALTGNPVTLFTTGALAAATLVQGYKFRAPLKFPTILGRQRYLGILYTVTTTNVTAGALTAGMVWNSHSSPGSFV